MPCKLYTKMRRILVLSSDMRVCVCLPMMERTDARTERPNEWSDAGVRVPECRKSFVEWTVLGTQVSLICSMCSVLCGCWWCWCCCCSFFSFSFCLPSGYHFICSGFRFRRESQQRAHTMLQSSVGKSFLKCFIRIIPFRFNKICHLYSKRILCTTAWLYDYIRIFCHWTNDRITKKKTRNKKLK